MELSATTMRTSKAKLSRTSTQKVRTGCITCKKRHIKCDEAKPSCDNCLKHRGHCEGYVTDSKKAHLSPGQLQWQSKQSSPSYGASPTMQSHLNFDSLDCGDATGLRYFKEFVGLMQGSWITAASNCDLWAVTLPQLARNNVTIRSAAIAIGALSVWHQHEPHQSFRTVSSSLTLNQMRNAHYSQAIGYYCRALRLQTQRASIQDAVFMSVLLLFFESLRGNKRAALVHVNHGLTMLLALLTDDERHDQIADLGPNPQPLLAAVADLFLHLSSQARGTLEGRLGDGPPLPSLVQGLKQRTRTLESFLVLLGELPRSSVTLDRIPSVFNSLDEYEQYWTAIQRAQTKMGPLAMEIIQDSGVLASQDERVISAFLHDLLSSPRIRAHVAQSQRSLESLDRAFLPLFNNILMSDVDSPSYIKAIHLRLQYIGFWFFQNPPRFLHVETLHSLTPKFREFLSLAQIALQAVKRQSNNPAYQLSLQGILSFYIFTVTFLCRDPLTRDEAMLMLKDYPGQDGLWSARSLYAVALKSRDIERINATSGTPTEQWQRLWRREFAFEEGGDRIVFRYLDWNEMVSEWQLVEEACELQDESEEVKWSRQPLTGSGGLLMSYFQST
ncbi:hypothetical protein F5Y15DRAFT_341030 [Xylariaceae sp. FL0016]|nr:hypothetical protein F5Y15DRAFT_341030 [Xylariaceae sp. FL0016]